MFAPPVDVLAEMSDTPDVGAQSVEPTGQLVAATPEQPLPTATPAPAPDADRRIAALMEREAALLKREQAIKDFQTKVDAFEANQRRFKADPAAYVRSLAPDADLSEVAKSLWYDRLGDQAPPEYRTAKDAKSALLEVERLRAEIQERDKRLSETQAQQEARVAEAQYVASLQSFATAVPDSYGRVRALATQKPDVAVQLMYQAASTIAAGLAAEATPEQISAALTPDKAAAAVEQYLEGLAYPAPPAPAQPQAAAAPQADNTTSLRNSHSAALPGLSPADPNDESMRRRKALAAVDLPPDLLDRFPL